MKVLYLFLILLCTGCASLLHDGNHSGWKVIWEDDFSKDGAPDPAKWRFAGRRSPDWACYCADNPEITYVKDGFLYLKAVLNENPTDTAKYQTACIHTKDKFAFAYGKIEVRAKLARGKGSWPAIWLMPQDSKYGGWPKSGEIDIMEHLNYDTIFYQTLHSEYIDQMNQKNNPVYFATPSFKEGEFNVFGMEWYSDRLDFFVNGQKTFSYPKIGNADSRQWPFDQKFYLILNQALGGKWVGSIKDEELPVQMVVDWVKVSQKQN
ncbi:glycoside hydrolase family 16 protein [Rufibacter immobilis]|uniref:glycoside hydrolase family 16 protein n=1 Tax=Rufibacter immobilis TaxID=1348778 RepID=UPI0035EB7027